MSRSIKTIKTKDSLTISIPTGDLTAEQVERLLQLVKFESIVSRSQLTQEDADEIAREINRSWWKKNGPRIEKMIAENE
jgi:hypothetical protein